MIFHPLSIEGAFFIEIEPIEDERGFFARGFCSDEFKKHGLKTDYIQCNYSYNKKAGTLRGMHFQSPPFEEVKLVRCIKGAVYDVVLDLRESSPTFKQWASVELSESNRSMIYIPRGCAHGYQTLRDYSEVFYQVSAPYSHRHSHEVRYNDAAFGIEWPIESPILSEKDCYAPDFAL